MCFVCCVTCDGSSPDTIKLTHTAFKLATSLKSNTNMPCLCAHCKASPCFMWRSYLWSLLCLLSVLYQMTLATSRLVMRCQSECKHLNIWFHVGLFPVWTIWCSLAFWRLPDPRHLPADISVPEDLPAPPSPDVEGVAICSSRVHSRLSVCLFHCADFYIGVNVDIFV